MKISTHDHGRCSNRLGRRFFLVTVLAVVLALSSAQNAFATVEPAYSVNVFVKDSATGRGIQGATVVFDGITQPITSNVMGLLTVTGVGLGTHNATATKAGYTAPVVTFSMTRSTSVTVPLTSTVATGTVTVQVYINGTSTPIANAIVYLDGRYAGTTNTTGQLTLTNVRVGTHTFTVTKSGYVTKTQTATLPGWTVTVLLVRR